MKVMKPYEFCDSSGEAIRRNLNRGFRHLMPPSSRLAVAAMKQRNFKSRYGTFDFALEGFIQLICQTKNMLIMMESFFSIISKLLLSPTFRFHALLRKFRMNEAALAATAEGSVAGTQATSRELEALFEELDNLSDSGRLLFYWTIDHNDNPIDF